MPADVLRILSTAYYANAIHNTKILAFYKRIASHFDNAEICLMPLKGIGLLDKIYNNYALRSMSDLDILVPQHQLPQAEDRLTRLGLRKIPQSFQARKDHFHSLFQPTDDARSLTVELHWAIDFTSSPFSIDMDTIWSRARRERAHDVLHYCPCLTDELLMNAFHAYRHIEEDDRALLKNIIDIDLLIRTYHTRLDWPLFWDSCREFKILRPLLTVLWITRSLFATPSPPQFEQHCREERLCTVSADLLAAATLQSTAKKHFVPGGLLPETAPAEHTALHPLIMVRTLYIVLRKNWRGARHLPVSIKNIGNAIWQSVRNYSCFVWQSFTNRQTAHEMIASKSRLRETLREIKTWVRE